LACKRRPKTTTQGFLSSQFGGTFFDCKKFWKHFWSSSWKNFLISLWNGFLSLTWKWKPYKRGHAMIQQPRKGPIYKPGLKFFLVFGRGQAERGWEISHILLSQPVFGP
jgi:hypothetical protein